MIIPIALSAAPQMEDVLVMVTYEAPESLILGMHWALTGEDGESALGRNLILPPGTFEYELSFERLDTLPAPSRILLRLEQVSPDFIHLGFPGSERGRTFELIFQE